ncbi:MAG: cell division protein SepF [Candidatus Aenigmatarchaeota archaeon]|nr:cell division protein SepF [Candidatus Aenigmarchaeota archaeon]
MVLNVFKKKNEGEEEEYVELNLEEGESKEGKIKIVVENLSSVADSDRIQEKIREGKIVFFKIKDLKEKDLDELKRAVSRISKTCSAIGGDIAGVSEEWIVATPSFAVIERPKVVEE